ncbi:hemerythrin family protein [Saccharicrinis aurantiacus]|uniref:hemerythrin family protein n=1 Tax=Saccharicrinis aurantiacus TaxID=1849719 RepID=UPI000837E1D4|nr:hemerythrin family protein [Saccharicrinis aurantiacus]
MELQQNNISGRVEMILDLLCAQDRKFKDVISTSNSMSEEFVDVEFLLDVLTEYVSVFEFEENVMHEVAYTNEDLHKEHHQYFHQKLKQFQQEYRMRNTTIIPRIIIFMKKWLVSHIVIEHDELLKEVRAFNFDKN